MILGKLFQNPAFPLIIEKNDISISKYFIEYHKNKESEKEQDLQDSFFIILPFP